eukprot:590075-Pyramimonas_sp.AAC.1
MISSPVIPSFVASESACTRVYIPYRGIRDARRERAPRQGGGEATDQLTIVVGSGGKEQLASERLEQAQENGDVKAQVGGLPG